MSLRIDTKLPVRDGPPDQSPPTPGERMPDATPPAHTIGYTGYRLPSFSSVCDYWACKKIGEVFRRCYCCGSRGRATAKKSPDPSGGDDKRRFSELQRLIPASSSLPQAQFKRSTS